MRKNKVLVVDDEMDFLEMIRLRLEANNYEVVTASDGEEALKEVRRDKPDVVLLDILMPGIDGFEVLKKIRMEHKDLPIFIITAFSNEERFKLANKLNASGFIVKTDDLKKQIENITSALGLSNKYKG
jgi:two-component system alkaline phosphatase synthesis response regulator PhoP